MKDILGSIAYLVFLVTIAFTIVLGFKARVKEIQKAKEELRKEGKLLSPEKRLMYITRYFGVMIGISIIISIIIFNINKLEFSVSDFLGMVFFVSMIECGIGAFVEFGKYVIKDYKKEGPKKTIIVLIMLIILEASYLYIKDFK